MSSHNLSGQTAVITGSSGVVGQALCRAFRESGAGVIGLSRGIEGNAVETKHYAVDLTDPSATRNTFERIDKEHPPVDILINNAGINRPALAAAMTMEDWDAVLSLNLKSALLCIQQVVRKMMSRRRGAILNISSLAAGHPLAGQPVYAASKGGLESLTRCAALELASKNIRVNAIAPGFLDSPMLHSLDEAARAKLLKQIPLARWGSPAEVADCALFLASERAAYITGQVFHVDGGAGM
ncbi:MAG: SDR family NAD(P)-dependent oxidoreductase [Methylacidiphilales bacterium]|nr:SDR family NAD(P)-dependent oxidoreductase [Candidatus Methylacidiphilales bacterium]